MPQVVRKIEAVVDDVSLVNRQHRIPWEMRLVGHHAMRVNRDQFRCSQYVCASDVKCRGEGARFATPLRQPESIVLDVKEYALSGKVEPLSQQSFITIAPIWEL